MAYGKHVGSKQVFSAVTGAHDCVMGSKSIKTNKITSLTLMFPETQNVDDSECFSSQHGSGGVCQ